MEGGEAGLFPEGTTVAGPIGFGDFGLEYSQFLLGVKFGFSFGFGRVVELGAPVEEVVLEEEGLLVFLEELVQVLVAHHRGFFFFFSF